MQVKLTLVLNKVDRLVLELQLTPEQAYERMKAIITQVNMILSSFQSERFISEADAVLASQEGSAQAASRSAPCDVYSHRMAACHSSKHHWIAVHTV